MIALIYLGLAIALGDFLCRRFYRFLSTAHRAAAAILVGIFVSTWFTYLTWLAFRRGAEALLIADLLFFGVAPGATFCLSRKAPKVSTIAPRAPGSSIWEWITLGGLFAAICVLLIGTLYIDKHGRLHLNGTQNSNFAPQLAIAQRIGLGHSLPTEFQQYPTHRIHDQFLFFFQAGNLEFLGLNLAWAVDVLSVLGLACMLALLMVLGELLFNSRVVGRLGATLFFFHGSAQHLANFLPSGDPDSADKTWGFWKEFAFVNRRDLPFAIGIFLLVLILLLDQYRQRSSPARTKATIPLVEPKGSSSWSQPKRALARFITNAKHEVIPAKSFVFSGLLLAALRPWNTLLFMALGVALCCPFLAYGCWWSGRAKAAAITCRVLCSTLTAYIIIAGVIDLFAVCTSSSTELEFEKPPLVKGLVFRNSVIYKIPDSLRERLARESSSKLAVTAFEGGHGNGRGQFDSPRGIAIDRAGNILVADTGNGRIEKFSPTGAFLGTIGSGRGEFSEPNGIAIDRAGNIYVAEVASKHRVQKLSPDGRFIAEWQGPAPGFYGPRRIAIGPDDSIYVVDQGRTRIVKFSPDGQVLASWGSGGSGDGQFNDPTSIAIDSTTNNVYVADPINKRIQVFDSTGNFLTKWFVPDWGQPHGFEDLAIDSGTGRVYASSANMSTILIFDLQGNKLGVLTSTPSAKLDNPSALAVTKDKLLVLNTGSARVSAIPLPTR